MLRTSQRQVLRQFTEYQQVCFLFYLFIQIPRKLPAALICTRLLQITYQMGKMMMATMKSPSWAEDRVKSNAGDFEHLLCHVTYCVRIYNIYMCVCV